MEMGKLYEWFEERLEIQSITDDILSKYVPVHVNLFYCFGGIVLTTFLIQMATGFAMTICYVPAVAEAFYSVDFLSHHVTFGWLIRSCHRWASSIMVTFLILHIMRVYLTGGFKKPRELIWTTGVIASLIVVSFGVTGYSLVWDQIGYWACKIVTAVPECLDLLIPGIGSTLVLLLRGGQGVGQATLTRFYSLHTFVFPLVILVVMLLHFTMIRKQGISGPL
jgi:cytochrome b6